MAGPSSQETREIDIILTFDDGPHAAEASGNFTDLESFIDTIDDTIRDYVLQSESEEEEEDQTQFVPNWGLTTEEIREILHDISWVANDPDH